MESLFCPSAVSYTHLDVYKRQVTMNVELAKTAGFCFGVKRAVETVYEQVEKHHGEKIYTYGPIIHNEDVYKRQNESFVKDALEKAGLDPSKHMIAVTSETSPLAKSCLLYTSRCV